MEALPLVRRASGESLSLDFREVAPASAHKDMFVGPNGSVIAGASTLGARAVGVPGELAGLNHLHKRFGKLPWRSVVQPAILLARDGFSITPLMHSKIQEHYSHLKDTVLGPHLVDASGQIRPVGSIMRLPPLAQTLERIAEHGADEFYRGQLAQELVTSLRANGGLMTLQDLKEYTPKERPVMRNRTSGYEVISMGPPSSGGLVLLQVLKVLEDTDLKLLDTTHQRTFIDSSRHSSTHLLTEHRPWGIRFRARPKRTFSWKGGDSPSPNSF